MFTDYLKSLNSKETKDLIENDKYYFDDYGKIYSNDIQDYDENENIKSPDTLYNAYKTRTEVIDGIQKGLNTLKITDYENKALKNDALFGKRTQSAWDKFAKQKLSKEANQLQNIQMYNKKNERLHQNNTLPLVFDRFAPKIDDGLSNKSPKNQYTHKAVFENRDFAREQTLNNNSYKQKSENYFKDYLDKTNKLGYSNIYNQNRGKASVFDDIKTEKNLLFNDEQHEKNDDILLFKDDLNSGNDKNNYKAYSNLKSDPSKSFYKTLDTNNQFVFDAIDNYCQTNEDPVLQEIVEYVTTDEKDRKEFDGNISVNVTAVKLNEERDNKTKALLNALSVPSRTAAVLNIVMELAEEEKNPSINVFDALPLFKKNVSNKELLDKIELVGNTYDLFSSLQLFGTLSQSKDYQIIVSKEHKDGISTYVNQYTYLLKENGEIVKTKEDVIDITQGELTGKSMNKADKPNFKYDSRLLDKEKIQEYSEKLYNRRE